MKKLFLIFTLGVLANLQGEQPIDPDDYPTRWKLELYYMVDCPHCQKVVRFMNREGIAFPILDIQREPAKRAELYGLAGMTQVPCLMINGHPLFESDEIIDWIQMNLID